MTTTNKTIATGLVALTLALSTTQSNAQTAISYEPPNVTTLSAQDYLNLIGSNKKLSDFYAVHVHSFDCREGYKKLYDINKYPLSPLAIVAVVPKGQMCMGTMLIPKNKK